MDEDIQRVTRRIHHVTGTHFDNGEDIQIVRYEPGQFYRVHHDQNTAVWAPQGPRVLTFFMRAACVSHSRNGPASVAPRRSPWRPRKD